MKAPFSPKGSRWRRYALCALCATLLSLAAWHGQWRWGALLDGVVHDVGFDLRGSLSPREVAEVLPRSRDIVIVDLPHEMPRPLLARLVTHLRQARVVALDLMLVDRAAQLSEDERPLFSEELKRWKREDALFAGAVKGAGNVVIGAWPEQVGSGASSTQWIRPSAAFERAARAQTHLGVVADAQDGLIRRVRLWETPANPAQDETPTLAATGENVPVSSSSRRVHKGMLPAFSLQVAALATGKAPALLAPPSVRDELWIDFLGPRRVWEDQSQTVVFERALNWCEPEDFRDKIVFVGETSFNSKDVFATPVGDLPGLLLHASAVATLLDARGLPREMPLWGVALLSLSAALLLVVPLARRTLPFCALVALVEFVVLAFVVAFAWARWRVVVPLSVPALAVFLTYNSVALFEYARARGTLGRVVGHAMLARLLEAPAEPSLGGKEEVATAFFCDLRGFSSWAQTRSPQQLIAELNVYTATVVGCVERFGGRPIDYFGDGVFVLFEGAHHARRSVEAALAVSGTLDETQTNLRAGVALHTGTMVIGLVGHANHFKPGAVGEAVNIAARVQSLSDDCGFGVLMTRQTLEAWRADDPNRDTSFAQPVFCGAKPIKGYCGPLEVFGLKPLVAVMSQEI